MAFGGPRSFYVRPGAHSGETLGPTATRESSHSTHRLRSLAFLYSSEDPARPRLPVIRTHNG